MQPFVAESFSEDELRQAIRRAYQGFGHAARAPLVQFAPGHHLLELFHGPTLAFKDFAMQLIGQLFKEEYGADFVFVTHYPTKKRPFYAMDDPDDPKHTLSFDLLFRGMEVTTGGQRIHDYAMQVEKMERLHMDVADFESYLLAHKNGLPPHGGLGIGLERLTMKLIGENNIREATLFPRDINRLIP